MKFKVFAALIFFSLSFAAPVAAQAPDPLRQKAIEDFRQWRESIPDYEKRLYDRVKKLNSRTVRIFNLLLAGIVLLLIVVGVQVYAVFFKVSTSLKDLSPQDQPPQELIDNTAPLPPSTGEQSNQQPATASIPEKNLRKLLKQQKDLQSLLKKLRSSLRQHTSSLDDLSSFLSEASHQTGNPSSLNELSSYLAETSERAAKLSSFTTAAEERLDAIRKELEAIARAGDTS